jgi:hypothetical protein
MLFIFSFGRLLCESLVIGSRYIRLARINRYLEERSRKKQFNLAGKAKVALFATGGSQFRQRVTENKRALRDKEEGQA